MPALEVEGGEKEILAKSSHSPIRTSGEKKELPISSTSSVRPHERQNHPLATL